MSTPREQPLDPRCVLVSVGEAPGLPLAGADHLASHRIPDVRAAVAGCPGLPTTLQDTLVRDRNVHVRRVALAHTANRAHLRPQSDAFLEELVGIAANKATPASVLTALANHSRHRVVREVLTNTSTPTEVALATARKWAIHDLYSSGSTSFHVAGAGRVAETHPGVIGIWAAGKSTPGLQSLAASPAITPTAAAALLARGRSSAVRARLGSNPSVPAGMLTGAAVLARREELDAVLAGRSVADLLAGGMAERMTLVAAASPTIDAMLAALPDLQPEVAIAVITRGTGADGVDPHVLARLADLLGGEVHEHITRLSGARIAGGGMFSPELARHHQRTHLTRAQVGAIHSLLGESGRAWATFTGLMPSWEADAVSLAETASRI